MVSTHVRIGDAVLAGLPGLRASAGRVLAPRAFEVTEQESKRTGPAPRLPAAIRPHGLSEAAVARTTSPS